MDEELTFDEIVDKFAEADSTETLNDTTPDAEEDGLSPDAEPEQGTNEDTQDGEGEQEGSEDTVEDTLSDDPETEITLGEETHKVRLSELKELYTTRQQADAVAQAAQQQQRVTEAQGLYLAKLYDDRLQNAQAKLNEYANIDLFKAYRELTPKAFEDLKARKEAAEAEYATVTAEAQNFMTTVMENKRAFLKEQAQQSIAVIRKAVPEWDDGLYNRVCTYAVSQGMAVDEVNEIVDAPTVLMMHKAMLYDDAVSKSGNVTQKAAKAPKRVVTKGETSTNSETAKQKRLMAVAQETGDIEDVAAAFLAAHNS